MLKFVFKLLNKKFIVLMIVLITAQQVLMALSTAALGMAAKEVGNSQAFLNYLMGFFVLSILPHFFTLYIRKIEFSGYVDGYFEYIKTQLLSFSGSTGRWQNHNKKDLFQTAIGPDAEGYIGAVAFSVFDIYLFALQILLNVLAVSIVVDSLFAGFFVAVGIVTFIIFSANTAKIEAYIQAEQKNKLSFYSYILKSWDNVFLKNHGVNKSYTEKLTEKYQGVRQSVEEAAYKSEIIVLILTLVSALPIFSLILFLAFKHQSEAAYLTALMVTIPRQITILGYFRAFFQQTTNLKSFLLRLQNLVETSSLPESDIKSRISVNKIHLNHEPLQNLERVETLVGAGRSGRFLLTGENGAGKSTLLLHLNSVLPNSFYLPSSPQLEIGVEMGDESTGQRMLKHLEYVSGLDVPVLLLDEWDANLDKDNRELISELLEKISKKSMIFEVRHSG